MGRDLRRRTGGDLGDRLERTGAACPSPLSEGPRTLRGGGRQRQNDRRRGRHEGSAVPDDPGRHAVRDGRARQARERRGGRPDRRRERARGRLYPVGPPPPGGLRVGRRRTLALDGLRRFALEERLLHRPEQRQDRVERVARPRRLRLRVEPQSRDVHPDTSLRSCRRSLSGKRRRRPSGRRTAESRRSAP